MSDELPKCIKINNLQITEILKNHINEVYGVKSHTVDYCVDRNKDGFWFSGAGVFFNELTKSEAIEMSMRRLKCR